MRRSHLILVGLLVAGAVLVGLRRSAWLAIDRCLDSGGRFDHVTERCER